MTIAPDPAAPAPHEQAQPPQAGSLEQPPADLIDRVRLLETVEADIRLRLAALDGR